ncbi:hypothetical protein PsYK624_033090 [Phanerochaete sordida]|uniref:Uncharacterized protein n=1 Tax=Phanerochaete sordida TaxID=48140 RepID=A0A9P3G2V3_9APHY|nr:hypothetical protein PsYK624_033090 [Phanerochaete sordida]
MTTGDVPLPRSLAAGPASVYALNEQLRLVILEASFFGVYTFLVAFQLGSCLRTRTSLSWKRNLLNGIGLSLYAPAAAHLAVVLFLWYKNSEIALTLPPDHARRCQAEDHRPSLGPAMESCHTLGLRNISQSDQYDAGRALTALLALNIILSDAMVLWRVFVLWPRIWWIKCVSAVLFAATIATLSYGAYRNAGLDDTVSACAILCSWLINVWATTLVAARAWKRRADIGGHLHAGHPATRVGAVLSLFVWCGMFYTLLWTLLLDDALGVLGLPAPAARLRTAVRAAKASVLVDVVGMYPATIAVAVDLSGRFVRETFCVDDVPSLLPARTGQRGSGDLRAAHSGGAPAQPALRVGARTVSAAAMGSVSQRTEEVGVKKRPRWL